jgi:hypothetical protein
LERFDDSEKALSRIVYQIGAGMAGVILVPTVRSDCT